MPLTKTSAVIHDNVTLTAGAADTVSAVQDLGAAYQATVRIRITNGATGPTVAAQVRVQIAEDTTAGNFMTLATIRNGAANNEVTEQVVTVPETARQLRLVSGSNTGQNVTLRAVMDTITAY